MVASDQDPVDLAADSSDERIERAQWLRLRRFGMALATYLVILVATYLVTWLGLGQMRPWQWGLYLGLAATGNAVFFHLFRSRWNLRFPDPSLTREQIFYSGLLGLVPLGAMPEARPVLLLFWLPAFSFGMLRLTRRQYLELTALLMIGY